MAKSLYIAEKPSVAREFANALKINGKKADGYIESDTAVITWCVGHLVTMSYPEVYDPKYKRWTLETLPFIPKTFKYQVIDSASKQFYIVKGLLNRPDIETIYICTDSGREGEYIYRLVDQMSGVAGKIRKRVWIDSQTEEEILRGIKEAKDWTCYDNLAASAYLRAKEDYLMGINFSRLLTLKYGQSISNYLKRDRTVLSVGRVMTCVLGMIVRREREIREFVKTPFYRVVGTFSSQDETMQSDFDAEWKAVEGSEYFNSVKLYKENGFKNRVDAENLITSLKNTNPYQAVVNSCDKKKETKNPPLLYNLAELQNDCSKMFKISPDQTLQIVQELYEKKLVTYPRTDARVLSTAVAKEIYKNISGLKKYAPVAAYASEIMDKDSYKNISKTRYVNDKQITDHYAIIPTGQGFGALQSLKQLNLSVYEVIARRFLAVFYPPAVYQKYSLDLMVGREHFYTTSKILLEEGYLKTSVPTSKKDSEEKTNDPEYIKLLSALKKGSLLHIKNLTVKEGETSPPKRYSSGSMILAMENAGQLIEDEELRSHIKGSGIGTSATRAEILKKLVNIEYISLNKKTQIIIPTLLGELIYEVVAASIKQLLNPELTASWEKGLTYVAEGSITSDEYMEKLDKFVSGRTYGVLNLNNQYQLLQYFNAAAVNYKK